MTSCIPLSCVSLYTLVSPSWSSWSKEFFYAAFKLSLCFKQVRITSLIYDNWLWLAHGHFVKLFAWLAVLTGFYPCAAMLCGISNGCIEEPTEKQAPRRNQKCHTCSRFKLRMLWRGLSSGIPLKTVRNWKMDPSKVTVILVIVMRSSSNLWLLPMLQETIQHTLTIYPPSWYHTPMGGWAIV